MQNLPPKEFLLAQVRVSLCWILTQEKKLEFQIY